MFIDWNRLVNHQFWNSCGYTCTRSKEKKEQGQETVARWPKKSDPENTLILLATHGEESGGGLYKKKRREPEMQGQALCSKKSKKMPNWLWEEIEEIQGWNYGWPKLLLHILP